MENSLKRSCDQFEQMSYLFSFFNMPLLDKPAQGKSGVQAYSVRKTIRPSPRRSVVGPVCVRRLARNISVRPRIFANSTRIRDASSPVVRAPLKGVRTRGAPLSIRPPSGRCQKSHGQISTVIVKMLDCSRRFGVVLYKLLMGALFGSYTGKPVPLMGKQLKIATPFRGCLNTKSTENV